MRSHAQELWRIALSECLTERKEKGVKCSVTHWNNELISVRPHNACSLPSALICSYWRERTVLFSNVCVWERWSYRYRWHHQCRENPSLGSESSYSWIILFLFVAFSKTQHVGTKGKGARGQMMTEHLNTQTNTRTCPHTPVQVGFLSCFVWNHNNRSKRPRCLSQARLCWKFLSIVKICAVVLWCFSRGRCNSNNFS